jgi:prepilin-type N-terminal cleavage/methylation domain-containing protein
MPPLRPCFRPRTAHVRRRASCAFTLIELLTVIAIIGVLAASLIPVLGRARESSRDSRCADNLRQIGSAIQSSVNDHRGVLPPTGFFGVASYYNRDARHFQNSLLNYLDLKPATTWSTSTDLSHSPIFECLSYKGDTGGKGYVLHDSNTSGDPAQDTNGNTVRPWGYIKDAAGTKISPVPQMAINMAANEWALRDLDSTSGGNHPGHQNHLYFDWHVGRVAVSN